MSELAPDAVQLLHQRGSELRGLAECPGKIVGRPTVGSDPAAVGHGQDLQRRVGQQPARRPGEERDPCGLVVRVHGARQGEARQLHARIGLAAGHSVASLVHLGEELFDGGEHLALQAQPAVRTRRRGGGLQVGPARRRDQQPHGLLVPASEPDPGGARAAAEEAVHEIDRPLAPGQGDLRVAGVAGDRSRVVAELGAHPRCTAAPHHEALQSGPRKLALVEEEVPELARRAAHRLRGEQQARPTLHGLEQHLLEGARLRDRLVPQLGREGPAELPRVHVRVAADDQRLLVRRPSRQLFELLGGREGALARRGLPRRLATRGGARAREGAPEREEPGRRQHPGRCGPRMAG
jgi:hypothetical protein